MQQLPQTLQPVERAISDLRRGATIVLRGVNQALLVHPAEGASASQLARLTGLTKSSPSLLLTGRRAAILGLIEKPDGAVRMTLADGITAKTATASPRTPTATTYHDGITTCPVGITACQVGITM